jgi:hypothetical protein
VNCSAFTMVDREKAANNSAPVKKRFKSFIPLFLTLSI